MSKIKTRSAGIKLILKLKRSHLMMFVAVVISWFVITGILGTMVWGYQGYKHPWTVYFYNAFTIFSNLNDDLGFAMSHQPGNKILIDIPMMLISFILIIGGMLGIAVLSALSTNLLFSNDEERFDRLIDDFRRLAIVATSTDDCGMYQADAHKTLGIIIHIIHKHIMPARTNITLNQLNIYEFEYIIVHVIDCIMKNRQVFKDPYDCFSVYDLQKINEIVLWAESLADLYQHFCDGNNSPVSKQFKQAWHNFSVKLPAHIQTTSINRS
ncbi:MAG: hypothetical protein HQK79_12270 [Desulfobacterales bacterium]|nr:hypothetical protein [Desulfobacterales bacterium]